MLKVPSFRSPDLVKAPDSQLIDATKNGKGKMPAYNGGKLADAQIKDVIAYIRTPISGLSFSLDLPDFSYWLDSHPDRNAAPSKDAAPRRTVACNLS